MNRLIVAFLRGPSGSRSSRQLSNIARSEGFRCLLELASTSAKPSFQHLTAGVLDLRYSIGTMPTLEESLSHAVSVLTGSPMSDSAMMRSPTRQKPT
jgi:hypothetical protein